MFTVPTIADFKAYFTRDFPYGLISSTVMDSDITKAFGQVDFNINQGIFDNQANFTIGYLFLSAHWLVMDLRMSSQGIAGQFSWLASSKSVGSVSVGIDIPQLIKDHPEFAYLCETNYGAKYLALILPSLKGNMFTVCGRTHA